MKDNTLAITYITKLAGYKSELDKYRDSDIIEYMSWRRMIRNEVEYSYKGIKALEDPSNALLIRGIILKWFPFVDLD